MLITYCHMDHLRLKKPMLIEGAHIVPKVTR